MADQNQTLFRATHKAQRKNLNYYLTVHTVLIYFCMVKYKFKSSKAEKELICYEFRFILKRSLETAVTFVTMKYFLDACGMQI